MVSSRRVGLAVFLGALFACSLANGAEPNEAKSELKFETSRERLDWVVTAGEDKDGRPLYFTDPVGPMRPTHMAALILKSNPGELARGLDYRQLLRTSAGQGLSKEQRTFISSSKFSRYAFGRPGEMPADYTFSCGLYATSEGDAKKMSRAFLEVVARKAKVETQYYKAKLQESKEKAAEIRKVLPQLEAELKARSVDYDIAKSKTHSISSDAEAVDESKRIISEMNNALDSLAIEIAGIEAKLSAVESITSQGKISSANGLAKLEEIKSEQTVELAGALARKNAAIDIRKREEEFYSKYRRWIGFDKRVLGLKTGLIDAQENQRDCEEKLANPVPEMLPPQLYQNKVTIHPVKAE